MTAHLTRVKARMSIHAHRKVRGLLEGEYASLQTGRSMDFADLREYVRGDDVKDLDWKASARSRTLLVKRYAAARKHSVLLAVSTGRSMAAMNDVDVPKRDLAVMVAGVVGYLATRHGDLVAGVYGDAAGQRYLKPLGQRARAGADPRRACTTRPARTRPPPTSRRCCATSPAPSAAAPSSSSSPTSTPSRRASPRCCAGSRCSTRCCSSRSATSTRPRGRDPPRWSTSTPAARCPRGRRTTRSCAASSVRCWRPTPPGCGASSTRLGIVHERVHDDASAIAAIFSLLERHRHARRR